MPIQDQAAASNHGLEEPNEHLSAQEQPGSDPEPEEDEDEDYDMDYGDGFEDSVEDQQPHEQAEPKVIPIQTVENNEPGHSFFLNDCKDLPQEPLPVFTGESEREDE